MKSDEFKQELKIAIRAKTPVIATVTPDEKQSLKIVTDACNEIKKPVVEWAITNDTGETFRAFLDRISRFGGMEKSVIIIHDLTDIIRADVNAKRAFYDQISEISLNGHVVITFTETNPDQSWIHALKHDGGISTDETLEIINKAFDALKWQMANASGLKSETKAKIEKLIADYEQDKNKIITLFPDGELPRHQVETIVAKCIVRGDFTFRGILKEFDYI